MISGGEGSSATRHKFLKCELIDSSENTLKFELEIRAWFKTEAGVTKPLTAHIMFKVTTLTGDNLEVEHSYI